MVKTPPHQTDVSPPTALPDLSFASVFHCDAVVSFNGDVSKDTVIAQLVRRLAETGRLHASRANEIAEQITRRERLASTAFGRGLAFPHLRTDHVEEFMGAIGILPAGVNFNSNDGEQTKIVFLTLSPYLSRQHHSDLLSRLVSLSGNKAASMRLIENHNVVAFHDSLCRLDSNAPESSIKR